jgi:hypothetical protein
LNDVERADILRAATGYALGEDTLGLARLHEKYAAKMGETPDARSFEIVSAPLGTSGAEFRDVARAAASTDTLNGFLRDMQARYPDASPIPEPAPSSAAPPPANAPPVSSATPSAKPEPAEPVQPARAGGKSA